MPWGFPTLFKCGTAKSQNGSFLIKKWQSRSPCALSAPVSLAPIAGSAGSLDLVENMGSHLFHAVQTLNHLGTMANTRSHIHTSFPHTQNRCSLYFIIILSYFLDFPDKVFDFDFLHCVCNAPFILRHSLCVLLLCTMLGSLNYSVGLVF